MQIMIMKTHWLVLLALTSAVLTAAAAQEYTWDHDFANGQVIPDADILGWADTRTVTANGLIQSLEVTLNLSGGWNGDLYGYLTHGDGFAVLLNHVGSDQVGPLGYGDPGMQVVFSDNAAQSIHGYGGNMLLSGVPTGTWRPGNGDDFSTFTGLNAEGEWSLFLMDTSGGGVSTVDSWGLSLELAAVPEPGTWVMLVGLCALWYWRLRRKPA